MIIIRKPLPNIASESVDSTSTLVNTPSSTTSNGSSPTDASSITTMSQNMALTETPTFSSSLMPRTTDSSRPLGNGTIIGIVVAVVVCLIIAMVMVIIGCRLLRKNPSSPSPSKRSARRLGQHKSESAESLTSFDTTTDNGQRQADERGNSKSPAVDVVAVEEDVEKLATRRNQAVPPKIPIPNISTLSLPDYNAPLAQLSARFPVSHKKGSSDPTDLYSQPAKVVMSDTALPRGHSRSQTFSTLPPLQTSISAPFAELQSASDTASPSRTRLLGPTSASPMKATKTANSPQVLMSYNLTSAHDSPHSLASLPLDTSIVTSPASRKNKRRGQSIATAASTTSPLSFKSRVKQGMSPTSVKSRTSVVTYLEHKPLPPSPPGPPAPPPPFPPPNAPLANAPKRPTPLRSAKSETTVYRRKAVAPGSEDRSKPFNELLHPDHYNQRSISETSLKRYKNGKQSIHISSLAKPVFDTSMEQAPKPVLKLDTSSPAKGPQVLPVTLTNTPLSNTALVPTPISSLRSAPANLQYQQANPLMQTPISAAALSAVNPPIRSESPRPISTAATTASTRPPLTPAGPFELSNEKEEKRDSLEPLPLAIPSRASRAQSQALSMSTTIRSTHPNTPTSASFLSFDPYEGGLSRGNSILHRSPSISVPIVFKFRMSKGKKNSIRRSARLV